MPAHFLLRYRTNSIDVFLDPFTGRPLTIDDCSAMAGRVGIPLDVAIAEPTDREIMVRMMHNAQNGYERNGDIVSLRVVQKCLRIVDQHG